MSTNPQADAAIAGVYAEALLDAAEARGRAAQIGEQLADLGAYVATDARFAEWLQSPAVAADARQRSLERMFRGRLDDLLVNTLQVMNRKGRLGLVRALAERYAALWDERSRRVRVRAISAVPLTGRMRESLIEELRAWCGTEPVLQERVRPDILGGLIVEYNGHRIDSSVMRRLADLRRELLDRSREELHRGVDRWISEE